MSRRGYTVTEVLVVIATFSILLALLVPAVQQSRESARLVQCKSNLHQIGVACANFESSHKAIPSSTSAFTDLLPYLEGRESVGSPPSMICPSDPRTRRDEGEVNFHISSGSSFWDERGDYDGILLRVMDNPQQRGRHLREITDGMSNTALFSERLSAGSFVSDLSESELAREPTRFLWYIREPVRQLGGEDELVRRCRAERTTQYPASIGTNSGFFVWFPGYNHLTTPNQPPCFNGHLDEAIDNSPVVPPTSLHRGGVSLLLCDGSTRFVSNSVDSKVWKLVGTRNDGKALSLEW